MDSLLFIVLTSDPFEDRPEVPGDKRTFRIRLDTNQYQQDMAATLKGAEAWRPIE